jgi:hypothetical protein
LTSRIKTVGTGEVSSSRISPVAGLFVAVTPHPPQASDEIAIKNTSDDSNVASLQMTTGIEVVVEPAKIVNVPEVNTASTPLVHATPTAAVLLDVEKLPVTSTPRTRLKTRLKFIGVEASEVVALAMFTVGGPSESLSGIVSVCARLPDAAFCTFENATAIVSEDSIAVSSQTVISTCPVVAGLAMLPEPVVPPPGSTASVVPAAPHVVPTVPLPEAMA